MQETKTKSTSMLTSSQIFTFLFLMLGPFKILGPYAAITRHTDGKLARQIAIRAILFASTALLVAAFVGEKVITNFGIQLPILALAAGIILFLVALLNILEKFSPDPPQEVNTEPPTLKVAMSPLAFPIIVTPYGIAAVIIFLALSPDLNSRLTVGAIILGIMIINLILMLINRYIFKYLAVILPILGAILGVVQVALGLKIIYNSITQLLTNN